MLTSLRIENFAIVSQLELDFSSGMTAFTGETGAGKSIMIDALMLALGGRADASVVRSGADKCEIYAIFSFDEDTPPADWLMAHDLDASDGEIVLRRVMYAEGRSKSYINGQPYPLQKVKELSEMLVDIHGQHQHQRLLQHATHRQQVDQYANHPLLLDDVARCYRQCQQVKRALDALLNQASMRERVELLQYQIEELAQLSLQTGELQALHEEHHHLHHAREYLENAQFITDALGAEDAPNVCQALNQVIQRLALLPQGDAAIKNALELINSALIQCDEAVSEITHFSTHVQIDPERLEVVEARMSQLHQMGRKYHVDATQLPVLAQQFQEELQALLVADQKQAQLQSEYQHSVHAYEQAAYALRESRQKYSLQLAEDISITIRQLGMPKGFITVDFTPLDAMQPHGLDKIEYHVCTNPGMAPDTLAKVASGGELSRISLAIQMIAAKRGATPTLLFDEVDVGIGGATAALVGQLLRHLGARLQLFCVTHQPQVASCAHHHFRVEKHTDNEQTFSRVIQLADPEKIDEIARMLGG
ncbi:MAG TPA: DNA repair protein RecN, partial [Legionella sp.]|nr:DNA repair protein RecN [Legionella sp.]